MNLIVVQGNKTIIDKNNIRSLTVTESKDWVNISYYAHTQSYSTSGVDVLDRKIPINSIEIKADR